MMMGPMKRKVITASFLTAFVLILIFGVLAFLYISNSSKKIAELEVKSEVVQRYVFTNDLLSGAVIKEEDVKHVDVKGESAPIDSYEYREEVVKQNGKEETIIHDDIYNIIGRRLKVNVQAKTIVTAGLFYDDDKIPNIDTRLQEFNMIKLPSDVEIGDYVDVRMRFPTGEDYAVLVGKKIQSFGATGATGNTVFLKLNEEEIIRMSSAIIESYINNGVLLYANKYVDPSNQLFEYKYVDLVKQYEENRFVEEEAGFEIVSGEIVSKGGKRERNDEELAIVLGIDVDEVKDLKKAINDNNKEVLDTYKNKLVVKEKSIKANYPVKVEVATLIKNNPNILQEVKSKYNVEALVSERMSLLDTSLTVKDPLTGEVKQDEEHVNNIKERLDKEISTQRTERQEYLMKLISNQESTNTEEE